MSPDTRGKYATPITDRRLEEVRRLFERYRRAARERHAGLSASRSTHNPSFAAAARRRLESGLNADSAGRHDRRCALKQAEEPDGPPPPSL